MSKRTKKPDYTAAEEHLRTQDSALAEWMDRIGPCTLRPNPDAYKVLVNSVISQLISTKAADTISGRLLTWCGKDGLVPERIHQASDEEIRSCGLSGSKCKTIRTITTLALEKPTFFSDLRKQTQEEIRGALLPLHGIGPWTVDMFLIFCVGDMDVLPVGDLGFRAGMQDLYRLKEMPDAKKATRLANKWQPYRTVATWYLWRSRGEVPESKKV